MPALLSAVNQIAILADEVHDRVKNQGGKQNPQRLRPALIEIVEQLDAAADWNYKANRELKFDVPNYSILNRDTQMLDESVAKAYELILRLLASLQSNRIPNTPSSIRMRAPDPESQAEIDEWKQLGQEVLKRIIAAEESIRSTSDALKMR
jgi:hypothetical protein